MMRNNFSLRELMNKDPLFELGRQKLFDLQSQLESVRASIALLKIQGLIAAKGTAIASYKAQGSNGDYYNYFKVIRGKNETLIHLGNESSQWLELFRSAVERRSELDDLEKQRTQLRQEIDKLKIALYDHNREHSPKT
jgi:predicted  nucleic acid-binding Zn-ribbon protein